MTDTAANPRFELFRHKKLLIVGVVLFVIGAAGWCLQLSQGLLATTNLSNAFMWGLAIAIFAFLVGFGAGGQLVFTYIVFTDKPGLRRLALPAIAIALACGIGAGVAITVDLGHVWHFFSLLTGLNLASPLAWDVVALSAFIVVSLIEVVLWLRHRESAGAAKVMKIFAALGLIAAVALQIVEGLIFALQSAHAWWNSPVMPIDFLMVACVCGFALMLLIGALTAKPGDDLLGLASLAKVLAVVIIIHVVLALIELPLLLSHGAHGAATLSALGHVWWLYAIELVLPLVAAVMLLRGSKEQAALDAEDVMTQHQKLRASQTGRVPSRYAICGAITVIAMFAHRLMLLYPAYGANSLLVKIPGFDGSWAYPISTGLYPKGGEVMASATSYFPHIVEWLVALLPIGLALIIVAVVLAMPHAKSCGE